jgi:hypothetical protein
MYSASVSHLWEDIIGLVKMRANTESVTQVELGIAVHAEFAQHRRGL